jgi:hypothetical protein
LVADCDARKFPVDGQESHGVDFCRAEGRRLDLQFIGLSAACIFDFRKGVGFRERRTPGDPFESVRIVLHGHGECQSARQNQ